MGISFSLIIPVYNEEEGIEGVLSRAASFREGVLGKGEGFPDRGGGPPDPGNPPDISEFEIIVVDDGSTDRTPHILERFRTEDGVKVVTLPENRGYGSAIKEGLLCAHGEILGFMDGDGTLSPDSFLPLFHEMECRNADIVVGSRLGKGSMMPPLRRAGNRLFSLLLSFLSGGNIRDSASGIRLFKRGILPFIRELPDGLDFTPALSTLSTFEGLRVVEVKVDYHVRKGRSKLSLLKDGIRFGKSILRISHLYNPVKFFGNAGLLLIILAILLSLHPLLHYLKFREVEEGAIYRLLTVLFFMVGGINLLSFGILSNLVLMRIHGRGVKNRLFTGLLLKMDRRLLLSGIVLLLAALILNWKAIFQYFSTLHIHVHWSYFVLGGVLFLCGIQLVTTGIFLKILKGVDRLKSRPETPLTPQRG